MATAAQITANQANAQSSTGPRTENGKSRSRMNALRHGVTSQLVVLPTDDIELYNAFTASWHADFKPHGVLETQFVQTLADTQWRLNRLRAHEANIVALAHSQPTAEALAAESPEIQAALAEAEMVRTQTAALNSLSLREQRLHKLFLSTLDHLTAHQNARKKLAAMQIHDATVLSNYHKAKDLPYDPKEFGFVLSNQDVDLCFWRSSLAAAAHKHNDDLLAQQKRAA